MPPNVVSQPPDGRSPESARHPEEDVSDSGLSSRFHAALYFGVQRARHGVDRRMIAQAARLLYGNAAALDLHVERRLDQMHGAGASLEWLRQQPLRDPNELRARAAEMTPRNNARVEVRKTSGSTGTPLVLAKDLEMSAHMDATMWAVYRWHGIGPGAPHARFWGRPIARVPRLKKQLTDLVMNRQRLDAFDLSLKRSTTFYHRLRRFRPRYAYGYPSLLRYFAERCVAANLDGTELGVRVVITTGELLRPDTRGFIEQFFNCRVVNEYGCTESGVLGFECEEGTMHRIGLAAYPEVVHADGTSTAAGEVGEVVVTDLYGAVMPLVRHRLFDRASWEPESCGCGRALPRLKVGSGRIDSFIHTPNRGDVYDAILAYSIPPGVQRFRAYQLAQNRLLVHLVPGNGFHEEKTPRECQERLEAALGPGMVITTQMVADIPHDASGKMRYFVPLQSQ